MKYKAKFVGTCFGIVGYTLANNKKQLKGSLTKSEIRDIDFDLEPKSGRSTIINDAVVVSINDEGLSVEEAYCILVHEAVHVWQHYADLIGEDKPSYEFEAYQIQEICKNLFAMYSDMKECENGAT